MGAVGVMADGSYSLDTRHFRMDSGAVGELESPRARQLIALAPVVAPIRISEDSKALPVQQNSCSLMAAIRDAHADISPTE